MPPSPWRPGSTPPPARVPATLAGSLEIMRIPPGVRRTVTYYNVVFAMSGHTPDPGAGYRAVGISGVARLLKELGIDEQRRASSLDVLATDGHVTVPGVRLTDVRRSELGL